MRLELPALAALVARAVADASTGYCPRESDADLFQSVSPARRRTVGVSTKMFWTPERTTEYIKSCAFLAPHALSLDVDFFIIPDFLSLAPASAALRLNSPTIRLGAQDCFWEDSGAYTGEISPAALKGVGCALIECGHAERRRIFGETNEQVAKKAAAIVRNGLTPLVCIGEKLQGTIAEAVAETRPQIESILKVTDQEIIFAYEPVWTIGKSEPASAEYVVAVVREMRKLCGTRPVRFLYGGSAGPGTFDALSSVVDGLLLGRSGQDPEKVYDVISEVGAI